MLIIKNGVTLNVTKGAYKASFADLGWVKADEQVNIQHKGLNTLCGQNRAEESEPKKEEVVMNTEDMPFGNMLNPEVEEYEDDEEVSVPLTEMTVDELKEFAEDNGISLGKVTKKADIIRVITEQLQED